MRPSPVRLPSRGPRAAGGRVRPLASSRRNAWCALSLIGVVLQLTPCTADTRTLRVGVYQNSPKVFMDADGTPKGFFVDIVDEIARREHWRVVYVPGTWSENIRRLRQREIDLLVDVAYSKERAEQFLFGNVFVLESWLDVYSRRGVRIGSIRDLATKRIAVLAGSVQEKYLNDEIRPSFKLDFTLVPCPDYPRCVQAIKTGAADVMVASREFFFAPARDEEIVPAQMMFRPENLYFAFPKMTNADLIWTIDRQVASMKNDPDSAYYRSLRRWLAMNPEGIIPACVKLALAGVTGLLAVIGLFTFLLRRQVGARTQALTRSYAQLKAANTALRDSESRYRTLFQGSADGIFLMTDLFTDCNEQACRLWKCRREDIVGHSPSEFSPPVQPDGQPSMVSAKDRIERALAGDPQCFYWKHRAKDGTLMDTEVSLKALTVSGKVFLLATVRDISARTRAEDEAKLSAKLIHSLSKYANDFIILLDENFRFLEVNERVVDFYGYAYEELLGMHASQFRAPEAREDFAGQIKAAQSSGTALYETVHKRKDGSTFPVEINLHAIDSEGRRFYQAVIRDISARKQAERKLSEANRALNARSKCSRALICATEEDALLKEVCRIVVEDCGYRMAWVGYASPGQGKAVRPMAWAGVEDSYLAALRVTWADNERAHGPTGTALRTGIPFIARDISSDPRFAPWREEAKKRGFASSISLPLLDGGAAFGAISIYASDPDSFRGEEVQLLTELSSDLAYGITALRARAGRRRAQEELEQYRDHLEEMVKERTGQLAESNTRLEAVNRELEAFSYSASHDLRAPLRSMEGFSQALIEDYGGTLDGKARNYLGRIIAASRIMAALIDDLLSLSRVTRTEMRMVDTDLSAMAEAILSTHARTEPGRSVECVVAPGLTARCDPRLLRIALENLLGNAWKFTAKQPNARIEFGAVRENGRTVFRVRDNGAGFEMEYVGKLFSPFQRLHAAGDFPGTGIGLAIVQRIISRHGGTVRAEGKPDAGATFCFTL